jgi:hypothetical protein
LKINGFEECSGPGEVPTHICVSGIT